MKTKNNSTEHEMSDHALINLKYAGKLMQVGRHWNLPISVNDTVIYTVVGNKIQIYLSPGDIFLVMFQEKPEVRNVCILHKGKIYWIAAADLFHKAEFIK